MSRSTEFLEYSGNYALKIAWNDGHETGLYTWDYLSALGREAAAQARECV